MIKQISWVNIENSENNTWIALQDGYMRHKEQRKLACCLVWLIVLSKYYKTL